MHVYVAGPYSPYETKEGSTSTTDANVSRAAHYAARVFSTGNTAITPHLLTDTPAGLMPDSIREDEPFWYKVTMDMLRRCDAILVVPCWQYSTGTLREIEYAHEKGIPIYFASLESLPSGDHHKLADDVAYHGAASEIVIDHNGERGLHGTILTQDDYHTGIPERHIVEEQSPVQAVAFQEVIQKMYRTHLKKNADYSPANILGTGEIGLVTRLWDKMARLMNLAGFRLELKGAGEYTRPKEPKNEPMEDAFLDLSVYGIIAFLLRENKWGR